ncbi:penicillin-binding transpeptidase domain-containing protein [Paenibacillus sp. Marseille-Q4541]|uniref:peptidoglycan D,D-transpeptidase FtsI family protein n=1 Tax=Paenibacillus sp. Marseille-Q4541 TaxID=2831522 RepID=UPI001BA659E3|nr:penicillin-binding transpeptidase domain-containing protein [Paenibacillus sp. Marseille-Q4541]
MVNRYEQEEENMKLARRRVFRMNVSFFVAFILFCVLIVRLAFLQFVEGEELASLERGENRKAVPMMPVRGTIFDATHTPLAYSKPSHSLYMTLYQNYGSSNGIPTAARIEMNVMAQKMASIFKQYGDKDAEEITSKQIIESLDLNYSKSGGFVPRLIKSNLSDKEVAYFLQNKDQFEGLQIVEETIRKYHKDTLATQTVGYLYKFKGAKDHPLYKEIGEKNLTVSAENPGLFYQENENVGFGGLELQYQEELRGESGYQLIPVDPRNMPIGPGEMVAPQKGNDLYTTLHKDVQRITEQAIMDQIKTLRTSGKSESRNAKTGYAVAMEVDTGHVVAMASMPDYDTNVWESGGVSPKVYDEIKHVYQNGTIRSFFPTDQTNTPESVVLLGSTIKPLSVLIGLEEGLISPSTIYTDRGAAEFGRDGSRVSNSGGSVMGRLTPQDAIRKSSNAFMVDMIGEGLYERYGSKGVDIWDKYMKKFGLGVETGIDLPNEYRGYIEYKQEGQTALASLAYASFGQQGKYTTMQLAQYAAMLANKGKRMEPHLVSEIRDANGNVVRQIKPKVLNEVKFSDAHWNLIRSGMATNVGTTFDGFPYDFARKTGTSQQTIYPGKGQKAKTVDNGVFIGFAPRENPKLAVAVMIPEGGFGSVSAAPVARKIFDAYDEYYGLDGTPKKKEENKEK